MRWISAGSRRHKRLCHGLHASCPPFAPVGVGAFVAAIAWLCRRGALMLIRIQCGFLLGRRSLEIGRPRVGIGQRTTYPSCGLG